MNRRRWIRTACIAAAASHLISMTGPATAAPADPRPNLVLIIADDMAWDDSQPYGHPHLRTPNLQRLANEGMRFDNGFVTISSCSPSRASIITGKYPHQTDAEQLHWPLPAEQETFVEKLKEAGYWTAAAGKWHLGDAVKDRFDLVKPADTSGFQLPAGKEGEEGQWKAQAAGDAASGCADWVPVLQSRPRDKPFLLWLAALDPHRGYDTNAIPHPHTLEEVVLPPYIPDTPTVRRDVALYYDEISRLDQFVGLVLDELDRQDAATNTLILFMSDNGRPFPRDKTTLYDSGIKTPWIVRWPGQVTPGQTCASLVSSIDIAPTFLEVAGLPRPAFLQGKSFRLLLADPTRKIRDYVHAEKNWHDYEAFSRALRSERFKYIRNFYPDLPKTPPADVVRSPTFAEMRRLNATGRLSADQRLPFRKPIPPEELYDLTEDPFELNNLAREDTFSWALRTFRNELNGWQIITKDAPPAHRTPDEFDRENGKPLPARIRPRPSKQEMTRE